MSKSSDIFGIGKLEIGDPGDGVMGTTLVEFNDIKEGSATLTLPKSETTKIFSETQRKAPYRVVSSGASDGPKLALEMLGLDMDKWIEFLGGTYATGKWTAPKTDVDIYKSIKLTTKPTDDEGTVLVIEMPYALLTAGIDNPLTFNDLTAIQVTMEAQIPVSAAGVEGDILTIEEV